MSYTGLTAAQTDQNSPLDQLLFDTLRLDSADHESRILILEDLSSTRAFSHFVRRGGYPSDDITNSGGVTEDRYFEGGQFYVSSFSGTVKQSIAGSLTNDNHYIRITNNGRVFAQLSINWALRTVPITWEARMRVSDRQVIGYWGFSQWQAVSGAVTRPASGVYLMYDSGTNWKFATSNNSSNTNGTPFGAPANNAWFMLKIVLQGTSGAEEAKCYIDTTNADGTAYVLKETFTTAANLPLARNIFGAIQEVNGGNDTDVDKFLVSVGGPLANVA